MAGSMDVTIIMRAIDQASSVINNVRDSLTGTEGAMTRAAAGSAALATGLAAIGAAMGAVVAAGFVQNSNLEAQQIKWTQLTGSTEGAAEAQAMFRKIQQESPFDNASIDQFITQMYGMGMSLDDAAAAYSATGNSAAAYGLNQEQLNRYLTAMTQAYGKGKLQAEEMNQMTEAGIPITSILGDMMGKTSGEIREMGANGEITREIMDQAFLYMDKKYGGSMVAFSNTWTGMLGRGKEALMTFAGLLTADLFAGAKTMLAPLVDGFENFNNKMIELQASGESVAGTLLKMIPESAHIKIAMVTGAIVVGLVPALYSVAAGVWAAMAPLIPFLAIGAALGALAFTIYKNWGTFKPFFVGIFNAVRPVVENFANVFKSSFQTLMSYVRPIWEQIKQLMVSLTPILQLVGVALGIFLTIAAATFNGIIAAIGPFISAFIAIVDVVANVVGAIIKYLSGDMVGAQKAWERAVQSTKAVVVGVWNAIKNFTVAFVNTILGVLRGMGANVPATVGQAFNKAKTAAVNAWNVMKAAIIAGVAVIVTSVVSFGSKVVSTISSAFNKAQSVAKAVWSAIKSVITSAISNVVSAVVKFGSKVISTITSSMNKARSVSQSTWNAIKSVISSAISNVVSKVTSFGSKLVSVFTSAFNRAKSVVTGAFSAIVSAITSAVGRVISAVTSFGSRLVSTFTSAMSRAKSAVSSGMSQIISSVTGMASRFLSAGRGLIDALASGIKGAFGKVKSAVKGGLDAVRSLLPGSDAEEGPLSDLTKSGAALFPTFAKGIAKNASDAARAARSGINDVAGQLSKADLGEAALFNGGRASMTVTHRIDMSGTVEVKGDNNAESVKFAATRVQTEVNNTDFLKGLRQEVRKR